MTKIIAIFLSVFLIAGSTLGGCASSEEGGVFPADTDDSGSGSCSASFCPSANGKGCCVTANGPCGLDFGMGCVQTKDAG